MIVRCTDGPNMFDSAPALPWIGMESGSVRSEGVVQSSLEEEKQRDTRDSVTGQSRKYAPRDPHLFLLYCLPFSSSLHITI